MPEPNGGGAASGVAARLRALPWKKILAGLALTLGLVVAVPPLRQAAALGVSKAILLAASPLTPPIGDFERLEATSVVVAADGSKLADLDPSLKRRPVELDKLPDHVVQAVLAAEDHRFYSHGGVDPTGVFRALVSNARGGSQGGSTITQQLAKINYTGSERTYFRKLKELLYATRLEKGHSKDELLERYLNQVYFGESAYGLAAAAEVFFATTPDKLTPAQAAMLAGKIRAPERLDPREDPDEVVARRNRVLDAMGRYKFLDEQALEAAKAEPMSLAPERPSEASKAPHFLEYVKREAKTIDALGGTPESRINSLLTGGFRIETTLDPKAYDAAVASVQEKLGDEGDPSAAVVSVQPGDGAIRNLFGGLTFARKFDVASQGRRQPGSSYKPFVYLAMLREGIDPRTQWDGSSPQWFEHKGEKFDVENYEGQAAGRIDADAAMVKSVNTVYMKIALEAGVDNVEQVGLDLKAPRDEEAISAVPSISLGGLRKGVTPLEMAAAYATFAAKGTYAQPYAIARILDPDGNTVYERKPKVDEVFDADEVGVLNNAMIRVVTEGTARAAAIGRPVGGKTGTTSNYADAWFVGYTPQLATSVWVGHPEKIEPMTNVNGIRVSGGSYPAQIFADTMKVAHEGLEVKQLHTASPDDLDLKRLKIAPESTTTSSTSSTTSTSTTSTTEPTAPSTTVKPTTTTTEKPKPTTTKPPQTTTTTAPPPSTTTTVKQTSEGDGGGP